ncbi:hypothetical protein WM00_24450 [Burkholderia cepacia]|nr:hypothetical protein WM00_24450 [Burkholderia cepacia]
MMFVGVTPRKIQTVDGFYHIPVLVVLVCGQAASRTVRFLHVQYRHDAPHFIQIAAHRMLVVADLAKPPERGISQIQALAVARANAMQLPSIFENWVSRIMLFVAVGESHYVDSSSAVVLDSRQGDFLDWMKVLGTGYKLWKLQLTPIGIKVDQTRFCQAHLGRIWQFPGDPETTCTLIGTAVASCPVNRQAAWQYKILMGQHLLPGRQVDRIRTRRFLRTLRAISFGHWYQTTGITVRHAYRRRLEKDCTTFQVDTRFVDRDGSARADKLRLLRTGQAAFSGVGDTQLIGVRTRYGLRQLRGEIGRCFDRILLIRFHRVADRFPAHRHRVRVADVSRPVLHDPVRTIQAYRTRHFHCDIAQIQASDIDVVCHADIEHRTKADTVDRCKRYGFELVPPCTHGPVLPDPVVLVIADRLAPIVADGE